MTKQILFMTMGLAVGGAAVYLLVRPSEAPASVEPAAEVQVAKKSSALADKTDPAKSAPKVQSSSAPAPAKSSAWSKLAARFGEAKTAKAEKVTKDVAALMDNAQDIFKTMAGANGSGDPAEFASKEGTRRMTEQLGLDEAQQAKAAEFIKKSVNDRMTAASDFSTAMRSEPENMMELFLAGDAVAAEQMTRAEYDTLTQPTRTMLENFGTYVMGGGMGPSGQWAQDENLRNELNAILNPEQQTKLSALMSEMEARGQRRQAEGGEEKSGRRRGMGAGLNFLTSGQAPVMELDKLEKTVGSAQQMATAGRMMIEAMRNMREAEKSAEKTGEPAAN
jgi:hypothetical protein